MWVLVCKLLEGGVLRVNDWLLLVERAHPIGKYHVVRECCERERVVPKASQQKRKR